MKLTFILLALICISLATHAQSKNTLSQVYGTAANDVNIHHAIGDFGYTGQRGYTFGVNYARRLNKLFSVETGFYYADDKVQLHSSMPGAITPKNSEVKMLTIPVYGKITFLKYLFFDAGILVDFQTNYSEKMTLRKQSGLGYELGLGGKYTFGRTVIFVNPYVQYHSLQPFSSSESGSNLMDFGYKFGVGYNF